MKSLSKKILFISIVIVAIQGCVPMYYTAPARGQVEVEQPGWAPSFDNRSMIHYYYFPDWGMYYDVQNSEYVYMDEGNWYFSRQIPGRYESYDFNTAYVVALDYTVHQPWMHHSLYCSHYPPYYYRTYYNNNSASGRYARGYNENGYRPYYSTSNQYDQPRQANQQGQMQGQPRQSNPQGQIQGQARQNEGEGRQSSNNQVQNQQNGVRVNQQGNQGDQLSRWNRLHDGANLSRPATQEPNQEQRPVQQVQQPVQRTQPIVYTHPDVGQPVRVTRQMQPPRNYNEQPSRPAQQQAQPQQQQERQQSQPVQQQQRPQGVQVQPRR